MNDNEIIFLALVSLPITVLILILYAPKESEEMRSQERTEKQVLRWQADSAAMRATALNSYNERRAQ